MYSEIKVPLLFNYKNGNYDVSIYADGTKVRVLPGSEKQFIPKFPENLDLKITNYCDFFGVKDDAEAKRTGFASKPGSCMAHCHEKSNPAGKEGDLDFILDTLSDLPAGAEIAIGGGNPLSHSKLQYFLETMKSRGVICNLTVNNWHLDKFKDMLFNFIKNDLIKGLGISWMNCSHEIIQELINLSNNNVVFHLILGVHSIEDAKQLTKAFPECKILFLGYKVFGNGIAYFGRNKEELNKKVGAWHRNIKSFLRKGLLVSFDNLAIKQLEMKRFFSDSEWELYYQGDDGSCNFYLDAVTQEYAISSRSPAKNKLTKMDRCSNILKKFNPAVGRV